MTKQCLFSKTAQMQNGKSKSKKARRLNGAFHYGLRTLYFCAMLNLCTIGILLCERSFDNSVVTFLPPAEIYLAQ